MNYFHFVGITSKKLKQLKLLKIHFASFFRNDIGIYEQSKTNKNTK